ncbi:hypothetical protein [Candidatus Nitrosotenuis sp. DW1]|uniref:hypothetical protein n=1 Tax=Candidatus Nitrosotenuis sp. DW1 TaxID=2259672 RepID=UPI0015C8C51A|nr:hypothetical protein [Candidatus Nitrosotenuis sp. DW1]QLH09032.1 hypothetical protein DSQ19_05695 [Candidatus Nitrosotenuis sp. DW1]
MKNKLAVLAFFALSVVLIGNAYAHKGQTVGDYNMEVGWKTEPPISGKKNAIEITITQASSDKKIAKDNHMDHESDEKTKDAKANDSKLTKETKEPKQTQKTSTKPSHGTKAVGISGLSKTLEVDVTLNGKKTFLKLVEDKKNRGTYHGAFTPDAEGQPLVHVVGKIKKIPVEVTFHPEKVGLPAKK